MRPDFEALRLQRLEALRGEEPDTYALYALRESSPLLKDRPLDELRRGLASGLAGPVADGVSVEDVSITAEDGVAFKARLYTPDGLRGKPGVFIHYHGGGFVALGGLGTLDAHNSRWAREIGCVVVAPDFRLPPEHKFPAAILDAWATAKWVGENAEARGWDRTRIGVGGGCTGGNLATVVSLMARDAGAPQIAVQSCTVTLFDARCDTRSHFEFGNYLLRYADNVWVVDQYLDHPEQRWDWRVTPLLADSVRGLGVVLIQAGEYDVLRDEARQYANRLRDAGVQVIYREHARQGHVFGAAARAAQEAAHFDILRRYIG